jgi:hypothetical protein
MYNTLKSTKRTMLIVSTCSVYHCKALRNNSRHCNPTRTLFTWWIDSCLSERIFGTSVFNYYKLFVDSSKLSKYDE